MIKRIFQLIAVLAVWIHTVSAQSAIDTIAPSAANTFLKDKAFASLDIGVIKNGTIHRYHFGPGKATQLFEIGSVTKTFTSLILAHAILEKRVKADDDIRKYLHGDYPNLAYDGHPIRLIHLVNLTSGLPNNMPEPDNFFKGMSNDSMAFAYVRLHRDYPKSSFLTDLHKVKLDTVPGLRPAHSNAAAQLLGYLLEDIYHRPFAELLEKYVTGPLRMEHTFFVVPTTEQASMAKGHGKEGRVMPYVPYNISYAFGLKSDLADMVRYIRYQLNDNDPAVKMTHQVTWGDQKSLAIGMNWLISETPDGKTKLLHNGTTFGFTTQIQFYPELHFGVVLLSDIYADGTGDQLGALADRIFEESNYSVEERNSDAFGFSPSIGRFLGQIQTDGFDQATKAYQQLKSHDPAFHLDERELNQWAYALLAKGKKQEALAMFKLNVVLYPESFNTYDSLAEIYEDLGDKALATKNYRKSLELNPKNDNAAEHLKKLAQ